MSKFKMLLVGQCMIQERKQKKTKTKTAGKDSNKIEQQTRTTKNYPELVTT